MRVRAGSDQDGFDLGIGQQLVIILHHALDAQFVGDSLRDFQADITNSGQIGFWDVPNNVADMHAPHTSRTNNSNFYFSHFFLSPPPFRSNGGGREGANHICITIFMACLGLCSSV